MLTNKATGYAVGLCLDPLDACCAKLVAGRDHDHTFVSALLQSRLVDAAELVSRATLLPSTHPGTARARSWAHAQLPAGRRGPHARASPESASRLT